MASLYLSISLSLSLSLSRSLSLARALSLSFSLSLSLSLSLSYTKAQRLDEWYKIQNEETKKKLEMNTWRKKQIGNKCMGKKTGTTIRRAVQNPRTIWRRMAQSPPKGFCFN